MKAGMVPFDQAARRALSLAHKEAVSAGYTKIGPGHILLGLIQDEGAAGKILIENGADLEEVRRIIAGQTPDSEKAGPRPGRVDLLDTTQRMLERVIPLVKHHKQGEIGCEHLLLFLVELEDRRTQNILAAAGLDRGKIRERVNESLAAPQGPSELNELLDTLETCRRLLEAETSPNHEQRLRRIEEILHEYFGQ